MTRTGQDGFTLIEGMIAGVVLAVGLLAMAGMQSMSLGRNVDANEVTRVTNMAADMLERIQFNRVNAVAYDNINTTAGTPCPVPGGQPMALGDCNQWIALLNASGLTNVQGLVDVVNPFGPAGLNQSEVTVTVNWLGSVQGETTMRRNKTLRLITIVAPE